MAIKDYSTTPDMNTTISGINIAEGCAPSGINNAIRQLMADLKDEKDEKDEKDAAQDAAISAAQSSADAAQSSADAVASETNLGRVKLSDSTSSTSAASAGIAASPKAVKDAYDKAVAAYLPVGSVIAFAGNPSSAPSGYLLCNGAAVSRTTYEALFTAIGTTYGTGNGSSTFNLPNLTDKFIQGSGTAGTAKAAGLPNISWQINGVVTTGATYSGATAVTNTYLNKINVGSGYGDHISTIYGSAASSNDIYGKSSTVQPPALTMRYYIKY